MALNYVSLPIEYFPDPTKGRPVFYGAVYVGQPNLDPEIEANRIDVTLRQQDGIEVVIQPSAQPLLTGAGGVVLYDGSPVTMLVDGNYSLKVLDKQGGQVYYVEDALDGVPISGDQTILTYENVAKMVADTALTVGQLARTKGYYTPGDGGGGTYLVAASQAVDGFGDHVLVNGNVALLQADIPSVNQFGAKGDGAADDTAAIQAAFDASAGGALRFGVTETYLVTSPLFISGPETSIYGNASIIDYYGLGSAIGYNLVNGDTYPVSMHLSDLSVILNSGDTAFLIKTSYSRFENIDVVLTTSATNASGIELVGDENRGTGPYYNSFNACTIQSQSNGSDHTGYLFTTQAPGYRGPNANRIVGGRVGQCLTGCSITGNGNFFIGLAIENAFTTGTCYKLISPAVSKNTGNQILGGYIENADTVFDIDALTIGTFIQEPYMTGIATVITDLSTSTNYIGAVLDDSPNKFSIGLDFSNTLPNSGSNVLDAYKEGEWIPTLVGGTTAGDYTIGAAGCTYTRVGRLVTVSGRLSITENVAGSGYLKFGGLPFVKRSGTYLVGNLSCQNIALAAGIQNLTIGSVSSGAESDFLIWGSTNGAGRIDLTCADLSPGAFLEMSVSYEV